MTEAKTQTTICPDCKGCGMIRPPGEWPASPSRGATAAVKFPLDSAMLGKGIGIKQVGYARAACAPGRR